MTFTAVFVATLAALVAGNAHETSPRAPDGTVVSQERGRFAGYDQASAFLRSHYSRQEYETAIGSRSIECLRIQYLSDGLRVVGFIVKPRTTRGRRYPVIIYNRGGFREIGKIDAWNLLDFYGFASHGFVVLASQYRGNDGGEGRDEVGGADIADVINLRTAAVRLPYANPENIFLYGLSRGGMMALLALKRGFSAKAVAVVGCVFDVEAFAYRSPKIAEKVLALIPDYPSRGVATLRERSAMNWPEQLSAPLLIIHGVNDQEVPATEALSFAIKLAQLGKSYEMIVYADDIHEVANNRRDRDARIEAWFGRHIHR